jgi:hypothetical protein
MTGAPQLLGTLGSFHSFIQQVVNGFGTCNVDTLSISSGVATASVSLGHGFSMLGDVGPVIEISGATPDGLNGEKRIASILNSTTFTFSAGAIPDGSATGTITAKIAPLGWSIAYSDSTQIAIRSDDITGNRLYLKINDGVSYQNFSLQAFGSMTGIDAGSDGSSVLYCSKGFNNDSNPIKWSILSDGKLLYFWVAGTIDNPLSYEWRGGFAFGDFTSLWSADPYNTILLASTASPLYLDPFITPAIELHRRYDMTTPWQSAVTLKVSPGADSLVLGNLLFPNPVGGDHVVSRVEVFEEGVVWRGFLPGIFANAHSNKTFTERETFDAFSGIGNHTLLAQHAYNAATNAILLDIIGPW